MPFNSKSSLYGISKKNSTRYGVQLWGKNQFNSTFPLSLCLHMRDKKIKPVGVRSMDGVLTADDTVWDMASVVGAKKDKPYYHFEKSFDGYTDFHRDTGDKDKIDLVVSLNGTDAIPLEIKLTVVPDSSTASDDRANWGPEMVMRPVSSAHAMMGIAASLCKDENEETKEQVRENLRAAYNAVNDWKNTAEILTTHEDLIAALDDAMIAAEEIQRPFLIQAIWKTEGQSLVLCNQCFDVFVWSDLAIMRIPLDHSKNKTHPSKVSRPLREVARHVRALYDILSQKDYSYGDIYKGMSLGQQTDKSFAISGKSTRQYLAHDRLLCPHYPPKILQKLILNRGESNLKPERRFDAAVLSQMTTARTKHG